MEQLFEGPHQHPAGWSSNSDWMFKYMPLGKMLISSLVTELGLDPETTKPEDLDKLDWRFTCRQCEQVAGHLGAPIHVYSWRPATYAVVFDHVREMHTVQEPQQNIDLFFAFPAGRKYNPLHLSKLAKSKLSRGA
ncbi:hypothetical protein C8Q72DRAFT_888855 [Fomitopsis betulina]|nr:hypothetical protein C8Q72DRAFT_888855 [Fomitopsis betulina]